MNKTRNFFVALLSAFFGVSYLPVARQCGAIRPMIMFDADKGGQSGGDSDKPKGTLEERLTQATSDLATSRASVTSLTKQIEDLKSENETLKGQFESASKTATEAQGKITDLTGQVTKLTSERDDATGKLTKATENVSRLETLCGVKGINPDAAPPVADAPSSTASVYEQWQALKKTDSAKAQVFYRSHKAELRDYAAAQPANV